jgi:hypothetical protein
VVDAGHLDQSGLPGVEVDVGAVIGLVGVVRNDECVIAGTDDRGTVVVDGRGVAPESTMTVGGSGLLMIG